MRRLRGQLSRHGGCAFALYRVSRPASWCPFLTPGFQIALMEELLMSCHTVAGPKLIGVKFSPARARVLGHKTHTAHLQLVSVICLISHASHEPVYGLFIHPAIFICIVSRVFLAACTGRRTLMSARIVGWEAGCDAPTVELRAALGQVRLWNRMLCGLCSLISSCIAYVQSWLCALRFLQATSAPVACACVTPGASMVALLTELQAGEIESETAAILELQGVRSAEFEPEVTQLLELLLDLDQA